MYCTSSKYFYCNQNELRAHSNGNGKKLIVGHVLWS